MSNTPKCLSIAVQVYVLAAQNPPFSSTSNYTHEDTILYTSRILVTMGMYPDLGWQSSLIQTLNSQPPRHATGILRRIMYEIMKPKELGLNCASLKLCITILLNCAANAPKFNRAFVHCRSIYWICLTMRRLAHKTALFHQDDFAFVVGCLKLCCTYLQTTFEQYGHTAVIQALEARLILTLVKSVDFVKADWMIPNPNPPTRLGEQYQKLLDTIAGYAMYYSVATTLTKALYRGEKYLGGTTRMTFKDEYLAFKKTVEERLMILGEWEMHGMNVCVNSRCTLRAHMPDKKAKGERIPFFRCSGCRIFYYCSNKCQKQAWAEHKETCRNFAACRFAPDGTPNPPPHDARDEHFMGWAVQQHILDARSKLLEYQSKYQSQRHIKSTEPLVSVMDFTIFPCRVETITAAAAMKRSPKEDWKRWLLEASAKEGVDPLVMSILPSADTPRYWVGFGVVVAP
ncbi:SET and MYND domain-containing protein 3 [Marasmius crinis-equi]|uniref:SET and MYND domain-containing protein 3 n=1 Tax=Marasmius crinis-equi TaxID=585013 RepID=A0ABR3FRV0_9AGAR